MDRLQEQRRDFLLGIKKALELLKSDVVLLRANYKFFDVVDFAALYAHVYKKSSVPILRMEDEPEEIVAARSQTALQLLFSDYPRPLLMIPPYLEELRNHLLNVSVALQFSEIQARLTIKRKENLRRLIENSEAFRAFRDLPRFTSSNPGSADEDMKGTATREAAGDSVAGRLSSNPAAGALIQEDLAIKTFFDVSRPEARDSKLRKAALKIAKEFFPELYALTVEVPKEGRVQFMRLFREKIVKSVEEVLPDSVNMEYDEGSVDRWFKMINASRKGERAFTTLTDAMACTFIEKMNGRSNQDRNVFVFVSPSESVSRTFTSGLNLSDGVNSDFALVRDLTYCVMAARHNGEPDTRDEKITESLQMVGRLLDVYESPILVSWQMRQKREQAALDWKGIENLFLVSETTITGPASRTATSNKEAEFLRIIAELHAAGTEGRNSLLQELERDRARLAEEITELNVNIPGLKPGSSYNLLVSNISQKSRGVRIEFPGLADEIPFKLKVHDRIMIGTVQFLRRLADGKDSQEAALALRPNVLNLASRPDATPEHHLLAGYILALENRYESALVELRSGLSKTKDSPAPELKFVTATVLRKLNRAREAIELIKSALQESPLDLRLYLEMANSLWLQWREKPDALYEHSELDEALKYLREAKDSFSRPSHASRSNSTEISRLSQAQIENIAAFIHTERALASKWTQLKDLPAAEVHIREMLKLQPEEKWSARFLDTRGYWYYSKAKLSRDSVEEREALLRLASEYVGRALETQEDFAAGLQIRRDHMSLIQAELKSLEPATVLHSEDYGLAQPGD